MLIVEVDRGGVLQFLGLLLDFGGDSWMAVAHSRSCHTSEQIEISLTVLVEKVLHFSVHYHNWLFVQHEGSSAQMLLSKLHAFLI